MRNRLKPRIVTSQHFNLMTLKPRIPSKKNSDPGIEELRHNSP